MRSILVVNPKGGCGKTTIATNLASYYAVWGVETALVDFDPQKSSSEWLGARPANVESIHAVSGAGGHGSVPRGVRRAVYDAPARTNLPRVIELIHKTDVVIIPVLPSAIDIRAAAHFIGELMVRARLRQSKRLVGVVANRVRENTIVYHQLEKFLKSLDIPFVTTLRDTQNYIRAAERGIGIFEMGPSMVERDLKQWRPLINWIEGKNVRTR
ncbi:MAG: ParA family protein [Gammaproteobacteria bacterium]|nr:ParA family protein [Gammaproteobacteria bacterium]